MRRFAPILALIAAAPVVSQQESRGIIPGAPALMSVDAGSDLGGKAVVFKPNGFRDTPPDTWPAGPGPDFDLETLLANCSSGLKLDVDAISIGQDWITATSEGVVSVPQDQWALISFSVTRNSTGAVGGAIRRESQSKDGAAGDLFEYVLPGSALPAEIPGVVRRGQDSREIDLGEGVQELDALDHFAPIYLLEPGVRGLMPPAPEVFFSLSAASAAIAPPGWFGDQGASGASILRVQWNPGTLSWSCPEVHISWRELALEVGDEVDALAIDLTRQRMLFSTTRGDLDPILFVDLASDFGDPVPLTENTGQGNEPVSTRIGLLGNDDVDAICAMDPSVRGTSLEPNAAFYYCGTPRPQFFPPEPPLGASAWRRYENGQTIWDTYMVGFPPISGEAQGFAVLFWTDGDNFQPLKSLPGNVFLRNIPPLFLGDPRHYAIQVPANLSLSGMTPVLRWFALGEPFELAEGRPLQIQL